MTTSPRQFANLLSTAVRLIKVLEDKPLGVIQDELGYALDKKGGGTAIEYWRQGHIPANPEDVFRLARELVRRGGLDKQGCRQFLYWADYPDAAGVTADLFNQPHFSQSVPQLNLEMSPFVVGPPIMAPRQFFGREHELNRLFSLWRQIPFQHMAVVGAKRSGKTSLLHYLRQITTSDPAQLRPNQRHDWLPQPEQYRWVFINFQDARMCILARLLEYILSELYLTVPKGCSLYDFLDIIRDELHSPAILLLDELGAALTAPELDRTFWGSLRSLVSHETKGSLAFVLAAHDIPVRLAEDQDKTSPFFNLFQMIELGPLTMTEALELIDSSPQPFASDDIEWILEQSGRWPALLQILCQTHLPALEEGQTSKYWHQEGLRQIAPFRYLLD
jgi:hypothetical protein